MRNLSQAPTHMSSPHSRLLACTDVGTAIIVYIYCQDVPSVPDNSCKPRRTRERGCLLACLTAQPRPMFCAHIGRPNRHAARCSPQLLRSCQTTFRTRPLRFCTCADLVLLCIHARPRKKQACCVRRVVAVRTLLRPPAPRKAADARQLSWSGLVND